MVDICKELYKLRGRGFHRLNQTLLMLLLNRAEAVTLSDYRPISLIHLIARTFGKLLSLRLTPKLDLLVSTNWNAFIPERSLHDNYVLVKQSDQVVASAARATHPP